MGRDSQLGLSFPWQVLAELRQSRNISIDQIVEITKITRFYVEAIENGELQKLPGSVYTRNYVRQYARAIDFDEEELIAELPLPTQAAHVAVNFEQGVTPSSRRLCSSLQRWLGGRRYKVALRTKWKLVISAFGRLLTM